jgi:peptidoglycan hydrolase CwlO-like protein
MLDLQNLSETKYQEFKNEIQNKDSEISNLKICLESFQIANAQYGQHMKELQNKINDTQAKLN